MNFFKTFFSFFVFFAISLGLVFAQKDTSILNKEYEQLLINAQNLDYQGKHYEALTAYNKAYDMYDSLSRPFVWNHLHDLNNNAMRNKDNGNFGLAIKRYNSVIEGIVDHAPGKDNSGYITISVNLCRVMNEMGNYEGTFRRTAELKEIVGRLEMEKTLEMLSILYVEAEAYLYRDDIKQAKAAFMECRDLIIEQKFDEQERYFNILSALGECEAGVGNYEEAIEYMLECKTGMEDLLSKADYDYLNALNNLAELYIESGNNEEARQYIEESLSILDTLNTPFSSIRYVAYFNAIQVYEEEQSTYSLSEIVEEANRLFEKLIYIDRPMMNANEDQQFLQRKLANFKRTMLSSSIWKKNPDFIEKIYRTHVMTKGLNHTLNPTLLFDAKQAESDSLYHEWKKAKLTLVQLSNNQQGRIDSLLSVTESIEKQFNIDAPSRLNEVIVQDLQTKLKKRQCIVDFYHTSTYGDSVIYGAFELTNSKIEARPITHQPINKVEDVMKAKIMNYLDELAQAFETIYIIPSGRIHQYSFSNLILNRPNTQILILNSATNILKNHAPEITNRGLIVGGLYYQPTDTIYQSSTIRKTSRGVADRYDYLPFTQKEITKVAKILGESSVEVVVLNRMKGTKSGFYNQLQNRPGIVHFSTHGFFNNPEDGSTDFNEALLNSGLVMGFNQVENRFDELTSLELMTSDMKETQLVFLSACESGLGKVETGDNLYGLQRAIHSAGVDNIILTLDKVDDRITYRFTIEFYTHLSAGGSIYDSYVEALKNTAIDHPEEIHKYKLVGLGQTTLKFEKKYKKPFNIIITILFCILLIVWYIKR